MYLLDKAVAFLASMVAGLGVGGGGLFVIYLTLVKGIGQTDAQGINLLFFLVSAIFPVTINLFKRKVNLAAVLISGLSGIVGTFIGAYILRSTDPSVLRTAFGMLLCFSGVAALFKKKK